MRLLLIGAPGSGKGTQGARIAQLYGVAHIAAGDILRAEVAEGSAIGLRAKKFMDAGRLVPDEVILDLIMPRVITAAAGTGYVLDGFPRSVVQATEARRIAATQDSAVRRAVLLDVPREELIRRLELRATIEGRSDDTPAVIAARLDIFEHATEPVLDFYRERGLLHVVDGTQDQNAVTADILTALPPLVRARIRSV